MADNLVVVESPAKARTIKKYLGKDKYPFSRPGEVRVMYEIEPRTISGMG